MVNRFWCLLVCLILSMSSVVSANNNTGELSDPEVVLEYKRKLMTRVSIVGPLLGNGKVTIALNTGMKLNGPIGWGKGEWTSPLDLAVQMGSKTSVSQLLKQGALCGKHDSEGGTPLIRAFEMYQGKPTPKRRDIFQAIYRHSDFDAKNYLGQYLVYLPAGMQKKAVFSMQRALSSTH